MISKTPASPIPSLNDITLADIHDHFSSNTLTSVQLTLACLSRIAEVDHEFNSVIETNPDALSIAQARDDERAYHYVSSDLHGIPILIKDNIPTLDSTSTICGSLALVGAKPPREAAVVTALRNAGAVILGKANMAEWAGFRSTSECSGWFARGGQTYGPFVKGSKASGSSSGSAVATALGLCFAAIGTETCWSIVSPAEKSGVVGYKPTRDLISSEGIIYTSKQQDTVVVMARTVEDALRITHSLMLNSTNCNSVHFSREYTYMKIFMESFTNVRSSANMDLTCLRIGLPLNLLDIKDMPTCKFEALGRTLFRLETFAGARIVTDIEVDGVEEYEGLSLEEKQIVLDTDMKIALETYLKNLQTNPNEISDLNSLVKYTTICTGEEYPKRSVAGLERAQATELNNELYISVREKEKYFASCIGRTLDRYDCNVVIVPVLSAALQTFAAKAGSPVVSVPMGYYPKGTPVETDPNNGLATVAPGIPFSMFVFGRALDDAIVLRVAHAIEKLRAVKDQLIPYILPMTELAKML